MMSFSSPSSWLAQARHSRPALKRRQLFVSLRLEELERRLTPSVTVVPQQFATNQYTALTITQSQLLAGDSGSGTLTASNPTQPANATLVDNQNGTYTFTPASAFSGSTTFQYTVTAQQTVGNNFGSSVSIDGDTAVVGSPYNQGAAYVFVRSGNTWVQQAVLNPADGTANIGFGTSVSISGDTVVVGAPGTTAGAAYVFVRSGSSWSQQAVLTVSGSNLFGETVSVSGDTAVSSSGSGSAYVFARSGSTWSQQAILATPNDPTYIASLSISGDTAVIGKPTTSQGGIGTAYVFVRSGSTWSQQAVLTDPNSSVNGSLGYFGVSVSIDGDTAVIGADQEAVNGTNFQGAAYVFVRSGRTWSEQAELTTPGFFFGSSVSVSGDTAIVGAAAGNPTENGPASPGAAYVFVRSGSTWSQQAVLPANGENLNTIYGAGNFVAASGDTVVYGRADPTVGQASVVDVYALSGNTWSEQAELTDPDLTSVTATAMIQVNAATAALVVSPASLPDGRADTVYASPTFTATGGAGSGYIFQESGLLPLGLAFDTATAQFVGSPTQLGTYPGIVIAASDGHGGSGSQTYTLTINHDGVNGFPVPYPQTIYAPLTSKTDPNADLDAYISGLYNSILDRNPEPGPTSLPFWENVFNLVQTSAQANPLNLSVPTGTAAYQYVADGIWQSQEHRWDEVETYYQDFLGRTLDLTNAYNQAEGQYWVNQFLYASATETDVIRGFLTSPEYLYDHRADAALANALNTSLLSGSATSTDLQTWNADLSALDAQRASIKNQTFATPEDYKAQLSANLGALSDDTATTGVLFDMLTSSEYQQAALNSFYQAFLRRAGTQAEEQALLGLKDANGNPLSLGAIAEMMLASPEYRTNAINSEV
jgi:Cadherin-like domain/FG-GAP repeat